jgi:hypothetical protein
VKANPPILASLVLAEMWRLRQFANSLAEIAPVAEAEETGPLDDDGGA